MSFWLITTHNLYYSWTSWVIYNTTAVLFGISFKTMIFWIQTLIFKEEAAFSEWRWLKQWILMSQYLIFPMWEPSYLALIFWGKHFLYTSKLYIFLSLASNKNPKEGNEAVSNIQSEEISNGLILEWEKWHLIHIYQVSVPYFIECLLWLMSCYRH